MNAHRASGAPRPKSPARAAAILVAVALTGTVHAQNPQGLQPVALNADTPAASSGGAADTDTAVQLLVGRSTLLNMGAGITRVSLTSPNVADAMVTTPSQLLIHGKAPGTISMFVWDKTGGIKRYEVVVRRDLSQLVDQVQQLFPGEPISVHSNGKDVVISGVVSSKYVVDKAAEVAAGYVEKKEDVVNLLRQQEGVASNQVLLRVRFAEVSRTAMTELGSSLIANGFKDGRWFGRTTTQQFAAPAFDSQSAGGLVFSDFLNLFIYDNKNNLGAVVKALQTKGLFQSLAEPNLIAENGKEASFLAGGEYPYPVVQGQSGGQTVTIQFKEFGVRLHFTPTIVGGDLVKLKVAPEVSSLDFGNAVSISGFRVPAITTRRTETEVELADGQTFAIAGLLNNTVTSQLQKIPGIGDIPILGYLFKSKAAQKEQTELVVMITPTILRRGSTGVSPKLPDLIEPYMPQSKKTLPAPAPWNPGASGQASQSAPVPAPTTVQPAVPANQPAYVQAPQPTPAGVAKAEPEPAPVKVAEVKPQGKLSKSEREALEQARRQDEAVRKQQAKQAEEQKKKDAQAAKLQAEQAEKDQKQAAKAAKEQARVQAELDRVAAQAAKTQAVNDKKQAEIDRKKAAQIAEAQARLDAARQAYEQQVAKVNGSQPAPAQPPQQK
jgi:pilus assembly protein CpaC